MGNSPYYGSGLIGAQPIVAEPITYYEGLLSSQFTLPNSPKTNTFLALCLQLFQDVNACLLSFPSAFDLTTAVGVQLDMLGSIVGANRTVGFQPSNGISPVLDDATYRIYMQAKIAFNQWNGKITGMQAIWQSLFPGGKIVIADQQNMTANIIMTGSFTSIIIDLIENGYIVPRPETVLYNYIFAELPLFGFDLGNGTGPIISGYVGASGGLTYTDNDLLTIVQAGASGGIFEVTATGAGGAVTAVSLISGGTLYSNAFNLGVTGGTGTGCEINIATSYVAGFDEGLWS